MALLVLVAAAGAAYLLVSRGDARQRAVREALRDELRTVTLENCTLKRYGSDHDGGYLLCENLLARVESAYSYGIGTEDNWGCDVSRQLEVAVHQYDCFTSHRPACDGGRFVFHDECVGPTKETIESRRFETIAEQIAANGDVGKRLLVKMDVEGAEWEALRATSDAVLDRIDQIAMELHGTDETSLEVVRRLKESFYLVNLNFNNWACTAETDPLPASAYQVLWVNKRIAVLDPERPSPASRSPENAPDNPNGPDCQL
jgi:hypothetical protein